MLLPSISLTHAAIWLLSHSTLALSALIPLSPPSSVTQRSSPSGPGGRARKSAACSPTGHKLMARGPAASSCLDGEGTKHKSITFSIAPTAASRESTTHPTGELDFVLREEQPGYKLRISANRLNPPHTTLTSFEVTMHQGRTLPRRGPATHSFPVPGSISTSTSARLDLHIGVDQWDDAVNHDHPERMYMTVTYDKTYPPPPGQASVHTFPS